MTINRLNFPECALDGRGVWAPELKGRTAVVTGAGRRRSIGRPVALELARQGVNIVLTGTGRSPDRFPADEREIGWRDIESVADEIRAAGSEALTVVTDISDQNAVDDLMAQATARFGRLDIVVNNAAAARGDDRVPVVDLSLESWRQVLDVNLTGTFLTCRAAARVMVAQGHGGSIINISSFASRLAGATAAAYTSSKAGVNALSRTLAMELASHQVRVNAVLPGMIDTARMDHLSEELRRSVIQNIPLGRPGTGMDVAYLCTFLCSDMGQWITGQDLCVDGGRTWH